MLPAKEIAYPISKSQYLSFTKCSNSFFIRNQNLQERTSTQHGGSLEWAEFESLCSSYFEDKIYISRSHSKEDQKSETLLGLQNRNTILGGYFESEKYASYIECLTPNPDSDGWILFDFRPVSTHKLEIIRSFYFQKKLLESIGLLIADCKLIRVQPAYVMYGDKLDRDGFLYISSVMDKLARETGRFDEEWNLFLEFQKEPVFPNSETIYPTCRSPKSCYLESLCFSERETPEIFDLREGHDLPKKLIQMGIKTFGEIPAEYLSPIQTIQKNAHMTGEDYFDLPQIQNFFSGVSDTVAFLDFESINPTIPFFPNTRPFQHVPFLFSLHIWNTLTDELTEFSYVHPPHVGDPRYPILKCLMEQIPTNTTIFSFNDFFERQIIEDLIRQFPEHDKFWENIRHQFKDLAVPFKKFWIYSAKQNGKASLKEILPAFSRVSHEGLSIKEGQDANYQYFRLLKKQVTPEEKIHVLEDLVAYCKMDTFGLFILYKMIKEKLV